MEHLRWGRVAQGLLSPFISRMWRWWVEPVQQRAGEALRPEDLGPLVEGQVGGHQDGAALVALSEDLEAQFVDDQQAERDRYRCRLGSGISSLASSGPLYLGFTGATPQRGSPAKEAALGLLRGYDHLERGRWIVARASLSM